MIDMEYKGAIAKLTCEREKNNTPSLDIAYSMAIEALEKQIPKKPLPKGTHKGIDNFYCSNCMHPLTKRHEACELPYCDICGQKIDWS